MNRIRSLAIVCLFASTAFAADIPHPALLVLNKGSAELVIVDAKTLKPTGRIPTGTGPHEVATDGKLAFVANYGEQTPGNTVSVIDLASQKELRRVDLGALKRPHGIVLREGKVYFTAELNKAIARYDPATDKVDAIFGTGQEITHMLAVTGNGTIYTANILSDTVTALQPIQGPRAYQAVQIPVGKGPEAIDVSPDGKEVWTAHSKDGGVSIIDTSSNKVKETLPALTKHSNRLKFTPDGRQVLISDPEGGQGGEVLVIDTASRKVVHRIATGGVPLGIQMDPRGGRAYVALAQAGKVVAIDLASAKVTGEVELGTAPDGMAWVE